MGYELEKSGCIDSIEEPRIKRKGRYMGRFLLASRAQEMRQNMTIYERKLWYKFLAEYNPPFRTQKVVGNYILDFYCHKVRLCVEVDGDTHFNPRAQRYDLIRTTYLEMEEIKVLRFTNTEVKESFESVCETIHNEVEQRRNDALSSLFLKLKQKS